MLYNAITDSYPLTLHSPGAVFNPLFQRILHLPKRQTVDKDVAIITWNSKPVPCLLEKHQDCFVLGTGMHEWHNSLKIDLAYDFINESDAKYIMGFDGFDVLVFDPQKILDKFKQMNCRMLISTDKTYFPCGFDAITSKWKTFQTQVTKGPYKYLNSGAWIAEAEFFRHFIIRCKEKLVEIKSMVLNGLLPPKMPKYLLSESDVYCYPVKSPDKSDQMVWNSVFSECYPDVQLDYNCKIFQTTGRYNRDVILCNKFL